MTIAYQDIVLLNAELRARNLRYRVSWQDASTACVEPPGECCLTYSLHQQLLFKILLENNFIKYSFEVNISILPLLQISVTEFLSLIHILL